MLRKLATLATVTLATLATPTLALAHDGHASNPTSHAMEHAAVLAIALVVGFAAVKLAQRRSEVR